MKKQYVDGYGKSSSRKDKAATLGLIAICGIALVITILVAGVLYDSEDVNEGTSAAPAEESIPAEDIMVLESEDKEVVSEETEDIPQKQVIFSAPCSGSLLKEFSPDVPLYSETLADWRVHPGIDISAPLGAEVYSAGDGIVSDMYEDLKNGYTIVIDHEGGIRTVYSNLMDLETVDIGTHVKRGDVISSVGDTTLFEVVADTHIHMEMFLDGEYVNPLDYFELAE